MSYLWERDSRICKCFYFVKVTYSLLLLSSHKVDIYEIYYTCIEKNILCFLINLQLFTCKYMLRDVLKK